MTTTVVAQPAAGRPQVPGGFLLGAHQPNWLEQADFPLFVSHRRLAKRRTLPVARTTWALDSGGFTELSMHGGWQTSPETYVAAVTRYAQEIGNLAWAAPQDWMVEPFILAKTGRSVRDHQAATVANFLTLKSLAPELPFIPVLQGWTISDYETCVDLYDRAGVRLADYPVIGLGSVCRRQATAEIGAIVATLADTGLRLHGFGVKTRGLQRYGADLVSSDSMAWSLRGRHLPGCSPSHASEANCFTFATSWRRRIVTAVASQQQALPFGSD